MTTAPSKLLSIVIPLLNESENIDALHPRLNEVANALDRSVEFIFVDDGSTDDSYAKLTRLRADDPRVHVLRLTRNFGSHGACLAGFTYARGDHAVILSADLQDPPELIVSLLKAADEGHDVVLGYREQRGDPPMTLLFSSMYNRLMGRIAMRNWPKTGFDFILISRRVRALLVEHPERNTSIFGQILWSGFRQTMLPYVRGKRHAGVSKWTLGKKVKLAIDSVVSFSYLPLRAMSVLGVSCATLGAVYATFILIMRLRGHLIEGWASLMVALLVIGGIQMLMLGVIGEYLWRVLDEVRGRRPFIVSETAGFESREQQP